MVKRVLVNLILAAASLFVWLPLLLIAGNALMSEGEMLERYGALFGMGNSPVKAAILPEYPTLRPFVELLLDSPGFYVMFWNSCLQTGAVLAAPGSPARSLGVCTVWIQGKEGFAFPLYHPDDAAVPGDHGAGISCAEADAPFKYPSGSGVSGDVFCISGICHGQIL